jgi:hypothetical protein
MAEVDDFKIAMQFLPIILGGVTGVSPVGGVAENPQSGVGARGASPLFIH